MVLLEEKGLQSGCRRVHECSRLACEHGQVTGLDRWTRSLARTGGRGALGGGRRKKDRTYSEGRWWIDPHARA